MAEIEKKVEEEDEGMETTDDHYFDAGLYKARRYLWPQLLGRAPDINSSRPLSLALGSRA